jgi:hypothetical protein
MCVKYIVAKTKMSRLKDRYLGRPAAVLGGGPSLPGDLERLRDCFGRKNAALAMTQKKPILIAVNWHAFGLCKPKYMVYNDRPQDGPELARAIREHWATLVSPDPSSDILFDVPVWTGFYSSNTAAWFGLWLGCDPVILCGMDLYQGKRMYWHAYSHDEPNFHYPLDFHLRPWVEEARGSCPHPERLRAMSGPLVDVFGAYQA